MGERGATVQQLRQDLDAHRHRVLRITADLGLVMALVGAAVMVLFGMRAVDVLPLLAVALASGSGSVLIRQGWPHWTFAMLGLATIVSAGGAHVLHADSPLAIMYPLLLLIVGATIVRYQRLPWVFAAVLGGMLVFRAMRWFGGMETPNVWMSHTFDAVVITLIASVFLYVDRQRTQRDRDQLEQSLVWADEQRRLSAELRADAQRAAAAALAANAMKSEFLARVSHELRTPLNAVLGYAELIQEDGEMDEASAEDLGRIHGSATHLLGLVDDVLDISRIESGHLALDLQPVDVSVLVREVRDLTHPLALQNGNALTIHCDPTTVVMDAARVRQILLNLASNASRFTRGGQVAVTCKVDERTVRLEVADTGIGIDPERVPLLFEPFTQATREIQHQYGGTGLGLALCDRLVRAMGGRIDVRTALGEGSTFTVTLPRQAASACA